MWKNVIKVMRSKFFKDTLKNGDYTIKKSEEADSATEATEARRLQSIVINSYADLNSIFEECDYSGTYAIAINNQEISLPNSAGTLPIWHSGIMVVDTDTSITLTGLDGDIVSAYYNRTNDVWKVKNLSGLSILGSDNKVTAPGLYAVTLKYSGSSTYVTHMISILNLNTRAYSSPDISQVYAVFVPETQIITSNNEVTVFIEKVVCIAEYNF